MRHSEKIAHDESNMRIHVLSRIRRVHREGLAGVQDPTQPAPLILTHAANSFRLPSTHQHLNLPRLFDFPAARAVRCITCALATVSPSAIARPRISRIHISLPNVFVRSLVSSGTILFVLSRSFLTMCIVHRAPQSRSPPVNLPQPSLALPFSFHPLPSELRSCRRRYINTSVVA